MAAVEFAVCLPIIVLIVLSTIEACSMIFLKQTLAIAAYEGARTAIIPGATKSQVETACNQILADRGVSGATVTVTPTKFDTLPPGDFVDVTVSAPCNSNSIVRNKFYKGRTLTSTASMMIEF
ncbi:MAG: TadE/TadG family type IV pilus assembly protein [Pirellulales bacterium]